MSEATKTVKEVKERPILFSSPMVRAILDGRKTQTRRVLSPQPDVVHEGEPYWYVGGYRVWEVRGVHDILRMGTHNPLPCPYGSSRNHLWVREGFAEYPECEATYRADASDAVLYHLRSSWRPSIYMPRRWSRITLEITNVRVERLNEISDADALAEGMSPMEGNCGFFWKDGEPQEIPCCECCDTPKLRFADLWDTINGKKYPWSSNPWVWVIEFQKI